MSKPESHLRALFRGGAMPSQVAMAVALGLLAGVATGGNLTFILLLLLAAVVNVHGLTWFASWCCGLFLVTALHNICRSVGFALLDELGLSGIVSLFGDQPLLILLDWDRYVLVGGLALAFIVAVPAAKAAHTIATTRARRANSTTRVTPWIRPWASVIVPVLAILSVLFPWALLERHLADRLLQEFSVLVDADVTAADTNVSIWTGQWLCDDIHAVRRENKSDTLFRINRLDAHVDVAELLRGRLNIQSAKLMGIDRVSAASVARLPMSLPTTSEQPQVQQYIQGWAQQSVRLAWVPAVISALDRLGDSLALTQETRPASLLDLLEQPGRLAHERSALGRSAPRLVIHNVHIEGLSREWGMGHKSTVEIDRISSDPATENAPTIVKLRAPEIATEMAIALNWHKPGERHRMAIRAADLPITEVIDPVRAAQRVVVHRGLVTIEGAGWFDEQRIYLPLTIDIEQLSTQLVGTTLLGDLHPDYWNRGLRELGGLRTECLLSGPWSATQVQFDVNEVVSQFKHQLRSAGAHELLEQMERYPRGAPVVAVTTLESVADERPIAPAAKPKQPDPAPTPTVSNVTPPRPLAPPTGLVISNPNGTVQIKNPFFTDTTPPANQIDPTTVATTTSATPPTPAPPTQPAPIQSTSPPTSAYSATLPAAPEQRAIVNIPVNKTDSDALTPPAPARSTIPITSPSIASTLPPSIPNKSATPPGPINFQIGPDPSMYASRGVNSSGTNAIRLPTQSNPTPPSNSTSVAPTDRVATATDTLATPSQQTLTNRFSSWFGGSTGKETSIPNVAAPAVPPVVAAVPTSKSQIPQITQPGERPSLTQPGSILAGRPKIESSDSTPKATAQPDVTPPPTDTRPWYQRVFK